MNDAIDQQNLVAVVYISVIICVLAQRKTSYLERTAYVARLCQHLTLVHQNNSCLSPRDQWSIDMIITFEHNQSKILVVLFDTMKYMRGQPVSTPQNNSIEICFWSQR